MRKWKLLSCLICLGFLTACAIPKQANLPNDAGDLSAKLKQGYVQKVDTALFVLDASSSMGQGYNEEQKLSIAKNLMLRMNAAIAGLKLDSGLHAFGPIMGPDRQDSKLVYGLKAHNAGDFAKAVAGVANDGITPIAKPLSESVKNLKGAKGRIAVILVSDGMNNYTDDPIKAAAALKKAYGDRICIYTILVGDAPEGKATLEAIAKAGGCGFATTAASLAPGSQLASFLEKVFLEKAPPAPAPAPAAAPAPAPAPAPVVKERVVLRGINFDFDKAVIKSEFKPVLDVAVSILKDRPDVTVAVEGHTCNMGTEMYNQGLSERRAKAVYEYLVKNGVNAANLSTKGYGELQPMADNKTKNGREMNRRVELTVTQ